MTEPHFVLTIGPGGGTLPTEDELFGSHGEIADRALDEDRQPSAVSVRALARTVAALSTVLHQGVQGPYVVRTPQEAAHVAAHVEAASEQLGDCLHALAAWADEHTPHIDISSLSARSEALRSTATQGAIKALSQEPSAMTPPTTTAGIITAFAEHLGNLGYRVTDVHTGEDDPDDGDPVLAQLMVELTGSRCLYICEDLLGWSGFIEPDHDGGRYASGDSTVEVVSDHDPRAVAELVLSGLGLPVPADGYDRTIDIESHARTDATSTLIDG